MAKRCSACGKDSPDESNYCNYCSRPLEIDVICTACGAKNPSYGVFCGTCGGDLAKVRRPPEPPPPVVPIPSRLETASTSQAYKMCPRCGSHASIYDFECPNCRSSLTPVDDESLPYGYDGPPDSGSSVPMIAGILTILTGVLAIGQGAFYLLAGSIAATMDVPGGAITCCGMLDILFGLAALFGGYCSIQKSKWIFAIVGAILAMLSFAFLVGFVLGLIAVILVAISKAEFME